MALPYARTPRGDQNHSAFDAPNAALLIDFDNVTMGMRSDLAKELRTLLGSDIIKGKVTVQRAYADWRRYPQYIVPLSEASIDLIFAPAYGSSKKNATDIRMAIDGMELVFIRPEIGTFILLTGDSDFSSLVLKLKEYGKYVVGIGIQESSSDILVQNCDEYYSYTSLAGLSKTSDGTPAAADPWQSVQEAVKRMTARGDVMRSDRLKQVLIEIAPGFDERNLGFKKFSRFLVEASRKGLLAIERGQNGQYAIAAPGEAGRKGPSDAQPAKAARAQPRRSPRRAEREGPAGEQGSRDGPDPAPALGLLRRVLEAAGEDGRPQVRDSTIKRRILAVDASFDEGAFGFAKFSKFLHFAADRGEIELLPLEGGGWDVRLIGTDGARAGAPPRAVDAKALGLPHTEDAIQGYLANSYRGVGAKTAEALVGEFGADLFTVLQNAPAKVRAALPPTRADRVLAAWADDYARRTARTKTKARRSQPERARGGSGSAGAGGPSGEASSRARRGRGAGGQGEGGATTAAAGSDAGRLPLDGPRRGRDGAASRRDAAESAKKQGPAAGASGRAADSPRETADSSRATNSGASAPGSQATPGRAAEVAVGEAPAVADGVGSEPDGGSSDGKKSAGLLGLFRRTRGRSADPD